MGIVGIILLAISLAMDCFSVSLASGMILKRIHRPTLLKMAFFFGLFQALMPLVGWFVAGLFSSLIRDYDHWIAFGLLSLLGVRMIIESFKKQEDCHFDPKRLSVILTLAVATSIDALAVGVTFAFIKMTVDQMLVAVGIIGLVSFVFSIAGTYIGVVACRRFKFRMEWVGGLVLIGLGVKILVEHLSAA